jgi:hypothetical protein
MPLARLFSRRRPCLALALLAVVAVGAAWLLAVWGIEPPSRAKYDQIQVGMSADEVQQLLGSSIKGGGRKPALNGGYSPVEMWLMRDGAFIAIDYDRNDNVEDKEFSEGDQSFTARVKRLAERLHRR